MWAIVAAVLVVGAGAPARARTWSGEAGPLDAPRQVGVARSVVDDTAPAGDGDGVAALVAGGRTGAPHDAVLPPDAIGTHRWPVPGEVVDPWHATAGPYGPGHRGIDLAVDAGSPVAATADGVVGFAGVVAGRAWVSVDHPHGLRTTVGPLAVVVVRADQAVRRGQVVGTAAATAHADATTPRTGRLHLSARVEGTYVDPAPLVGRLVATLLAPTTDVATR